jgi:hypothetical protein
MLSVEIQWTDVLHEKDTLFACDVDESARFSRCCRERLINQDGVKGISVPPSGTKEYLSHFFAENVLQRASWAETSVNREQPLLALAKAVNLSGQQGCLSWLIVLRMSGPYV